MLTPASGSFFSLVTLPASFPVVPAHAAGIGNAAATPRSSSQAARKAMRDIRTSPFRDGDSGPGRADSGAKQETRSGTGGTTEARGVAGVSNLPDPIVGP